MTEEEKTTARKEKVRAVASHCLPKRMHRLCRTAAASYHRLLFVGSPVLYALWKA
jgi:hypothetical protein